MDSRAESPLGGISSVTSPAGSPPASPTATEALAQLEGLLRLEGIPTFFATPLLAAGATAEAILLGSKSQLNAWARAVSLPVGHRLKLQSAVAAVGGAAG